MYEMEYKEFFEDSDKFSEEDQKKIDFVVNEAREILFKEMEKPGKVGLSTEATLQRFCSIFNRRLRYISNTIKLKFIRPMDNITSEEALAKLKNLKIATLDSY